MLTGECQGDSSNLLKMDPGTYLKSLVKIGSSTTEILLTLSLWWVVGGSAGGGAVGVQSQFHDKPKLS